MPTTLQNCQYVETACCNYSQAESKDPRGARKTLEDLIKAYPQSEAAQAGRDRLPTIK